MDVVDALKVNRPMKHDWWLTFLFFTMLFSSFVFVEPSPYDLLMVALIALGFTFSRFVYNQLLSIPILLMVVFVISNLISAYFAKNYNGAVFYFAITLYLILTWYGLAGALQLYKENLIKIVLKGYTAAALIAVIIGILAYFSILPNSETFLSFERVKSTFKDPNVFGPFVVVPALFTLYKVEISTGTRKVMYFVLFLIFIVGVLLSFSRAAWGNMGLGLVGYFFLLSTMPLKKRVITLALFSIVGFPFLFYLMNTPVIENLLSQRLSIHDYDENRFATQQEAFTQGFSNLLGIGPGQSEESFAISTHSLYARLFTENGLIGFLSFITFMMYSLIQSFKNIYWSAVESKGLYVIVSISIVGLIFNSFFIDTLHWRHFWIMLALAWCSIDRGEKVENFKV